MVPTLYFSVLTRDKIIIFGHKFLAMPKKAYVSPSGVHSFTSHQAGSLLHLLMGNSKKIHFQPIKVV
jgi:hypothetical protein